MSPLVTTNSAQRLAELRFCIEELHRRQHADRRRAWLWQLKENAARQTLVMLKSELGNEPIELSATEQRQIMAHHPLLQEPRVPSQTKFVPKWQRELQAHARQAMQNQLEQIQQQRGPSVSA